MNANNYAYYGGKAYYSASISDFLRDDSSRILGELVRNAWDDNQEQRNA